MHVAPLQDQPERASLHLCVLVANPSGCHMLGQPERGAQAQVCAILLQGQPERGALVPKGACGCMLHHIVGPTRAGARVRKHHRWQGQPERVPSASAQDKCGVTDARPANASELRCRLCTCIHPAHSCFHHSPSQLAVIPSSLQPSLVRLSFHLRSVLTRVLCPPPSLTAFPQRTGMLRSRPFSSHASPG